MISADLEDCIVGWDFLKDRILWKFTGKDAVEAMLATKRTLIYINSAGPSPINGSGRVFFWDLERQKELDTHIKTKYDPSTLRIGADGKSLIAGEIERDGSIVMALPF